jgi:hypothetical protein
MQMWILLGVLIFAEILVFSRIPVALMRGSVPLNPLGWFGYGELLEVSIDRKAYPVGYWMIVAVLAVAALLFGFFIYMLLSHSMATAAL